MTVETEHGGIVQLGQELYSWTLPFLLAQLGQELYSWTLPFWRG